MCSGPGQYGVNIPHSSLYGALYIRIYTQKSSFPILNMSLYLLGEKKALETELVKPTNPNTLKSGNTIFHRAFEIYVHSTCAQNQAKALWRNGL